MTSARQRKKRQHRKGPSAPRVIGANDNHLLGANDDEVIVVRGVSLTKNQALRMLKAEADQASNDLVRRKAGRDAMAALNAEIDLAALVVERGAQADETVALENRRGNTASVEWVQGKDDKGKLEPRPLPRVKITSRDGLETLRTSQSISAIQHAAGLRYRTDYEAIDPEKGLTPPSIDQTRKPNHGGDGYAAKRREIEERVFGIHCMICGVDAPTGEQRAALPSFPAGHPASRAIFALNYIAGRGDNLSDMTTSGSVKARIREDLIFALDACAITYGLE
ncbi:hypothetical protein [Brevundimonas sp. NIBR11]|uniref:hypothetical protein n=1 Tax=Brevundimonas sp. NIBR11 TaxID=3015999 RepID=UPI0022F0A9FC|nr:hypothetical protein [Brevundimonas sp. NIBR11]WGM31482.1 hypothetical protein KKHFBJBL_01729 [Brevundimonas sp. NIBR11]